MFAEFGDAVSTGGVAARELEWRVVYFKGPSGAVQLFKWASFGDLRVVAQLLGCSVQAARYAGIVHECFAFLSGTFLRSTLCFGNKSAHVFIALQVLCKTWIVDQIFASHCPRY